MAEVDTSSYPKPALPVSMLDTAAKIGGLYQQKNTLQQQELGISQQKLDQANQGFDYLTRAMGSIGPNPGPDWKQKYLEVGQNAVRLGLVPANTLNVWADRVNSAPDSNTFYSQVTNAVQSHQQQIQNYQGSPAQVQDQANNYQGVQRSAQQGGGFQPSTQMPVQQAPGTPYYQGGQAKSLPAAGPSGVTSVQAPSSSLPAQRPPAAIPGPVNGVAGPSANFGGTVTGATVGPPTNAATGQPIQTAQSPTAGNTGGALNTAAPPNFEAGQKQYSTDIVNATSKATALKPLEEAYDLAKQVDKTGVGSENLNKIRAYLTNAGLISPSEKNPAVIYQMLNKNLSQFIDKNGSRSDADLAVKESGNANAKTQLQPALLHMVQKIIGRERMEIARPQAFEGQDFENYSKHAASFPTNQDERAYSLDKMPAAEASQLYQSERDKALSDNPKDKAEGIKFLKSLSIAKKYGGVTGLGQ